MMVALLLYAYACGNRSSRGLSGSAVMTLVPRDRGKPGAGSFTIAEFRCRHEEALAGLFGEVLVLCREAGLLNVGLVAIDGTKVSANASSMTNRDYRQVALEILAEADRIDREEDALYGASRGDELPEHLRTAEGRRKALKEAKERLRARAERERPDAEGDAEVGVALVFDQEAIVARVQGRAGWLREAKRQLDDHRQSHPRPVPRDRLGRLLACEQRLVEDLAVEREANQAYEAYRARGVMKNGRRFGGPPKAYVPPAEPVGKVNTSDPDSKNVKAFRGYVQGYNAQAVVTEQQIVIAAELNTDPQDFSHLAPMFNAAQRERRRGTLSGGSSDQLTDDVGLSGVGLVAPLGSAPLSILSRSCPSVLSGAAVCCRGGSSRLTATGSPRSCSSPASCRASLSSSATVPDCRSRPLRSTRRQDCWIPSTRPSALSRLS